jgi:hypothetical protein
MSSAKKAADDLQVAIADARKAFKAATEGKGLVAALLTNPELTNDLRALISNLRAHGVLFYRDSAAKVDINAQERNSPPRKTGRRQ